MDAYNLREMWGATVLRGVLAILFGIVAIFWPGLTLVALVYLFGGYILVTGLVNEVAGVTKFSDSGRSFWGRVLLIVWGVVAVGVGVYLLRHPSVGFATLVLLIGLTLIVNALFDLFAGFFSDGSTEHRTMLVITGVLAAVAGILVWRQPVASGVAFVWILGLYALITGPLMIAVAQDARKEFAAPAARGRSAR